MTLLSLLILVFLKIRAQKIYVDIGQILPFLLTLPKAMIQMSKALSKLR